MKDSLPRKLLNMIPQNFRLPVLVLLAVVIIGLVLLFGAKAWNWAGTTVHDWRVSAAKNEISAAKEEAAQSKREADQKVAAFETAKKLYEEEKKKREIAEQILADKTKNTDQKLAAYEAAVNAPRTATGAESTDELCKRAAALGIPCN